ncbi:Holliday junction resolvase RecU [Fusibacter sp. JL216-2]|uniref:Holliday junction resolvase RecU n=1 Tax=Fusibacter sp. JL216-2 TaxID=3071453 RepID=UPI003D343472
MTVWRSRGLRGSDLEDLIHETIEYYRQQGLARIDKIATPIKVVDIDGQGTITKAFFEKKSTVDFMGIIQGVGVAFDAKETNLKSLPLSNIHEHQLEFMEDISKQSGLAFLIVHFKFCDEFYLLPYETLMQYVRASEKGARKSIPYSGMDPNLKIEMIRGNILNFLPALNVYLNYRKNKSI